MINSLHILNFILLFNNVFTIREIHDKQIFYNFITYENELYVGSNNGIYKVNSSQENNLIHFNKSITGAIKSDFSKNEDFKIKFITPPKIYPDFYSKSVTDFAYLDNMLFVISRGKMLVYDNLNYTFSPYGSVRAIYKNAVGSYNGVFINGNKLNKITYTDGQIREFDSTIFVCYNGLLAYENNRETIIYDNDNSIRTKGEYGNISDIILIRNSNYLLISNKGIFNYDNDSNTFNLIYECQNKIIPIKNKIDNRIKDRSEFHFIDNDRYISINTNNFVVEIIDNELNYKISDVLESEINGNYFYAISKNKALLKLKRTVNGLKLIDETALKKTAHTITDYGDLIFLSGNNGLSIFDKVKKKIIYNYIVDEFNSNSVYKTNNFISFGSIHGIYTINNVKDFQRNLKFNDYKINNQKSHLYVGAIILIIISILTIWLFSNKNISDDQLVKKIKHFITKNLSLVTLKMLEIEFSLDYNEINSLDKNFKPAKYIKKQRIDLTKKMLLDNKSISEISNKTGYSETYLIKNKYKFLN
ncbi:MAG: hypothetical protein P8N69_01390 [Flavobacteriales bacterium]|nr:hypothetical protein [Flavobacteriales bacterium]